MNVYTLTLDNIIVLETMDPLSRNLEEEEIMENIIDEDTSQYLNLEGHDDSSSSHGEDDDSGERTLVITKSVEVYAWIKPLLTSTNNLLLHVLINASFLFKPSRSTSQQPSSSTKKSKRGASHRLKDRAKFTIEAVRVDGRPMEPKNAAEKFVHREIGRAHV